MMMMMMIVVVITINKNAEIKHPSLLVIVSFEFSHFINTSFLFLLWIRNGCYSFPFPRPSHFINMYFLFLCTRNGCCSFLVPRLLLFVHILVRCFLLHRPSQAQGNTNNYTRNNNKSNICLIYMKFICDIFCQELVHKHHFITTTMYKWHLIKLCICTM